MIRNITILFVLISLTFLILTSCEDQIINKAPQEAFSEEDVWSDIELVKKYVWNNYNAFGGWYVTSTDMTFVVGDNAYRINHSKVWHTANISPAQMGVWSDKWESNYQYIRNANVFFSRIDDVKADESEKERLKGEMKFIRAWCYSELLNLFGGVPIIKKPFNLNEDVQASRVPYQTGIEWVVKELDEAKNMVPESVPSSEWGRVTKGTVLALKARILLYAASKLHTPGTEPSGPLYDYDKANKWKEAADASKAVMDMNQYSLVQVDNWKDYQQMFLHNTPEIIFARPFSSQYLKDTPNIDIVNSPNGYYGGWGGAVPTHNFISVFQMKDGRSINESPLYNSSADSIYMNRELRFYANIVYQEANYRGRKTEYYVPGGQDSPDGPSGWNFSTTGYSMRKHMNESINPSRTNATTPRIYFRLAEFYLNYAEAQFHLGNESVARTYINRIRSRVHLPDIHSSGSKLLRDIRHERRIELSFEGYHRFNDVRRWMIGKETLGKDAKGIKWERVNEQGEQVVDGKLTYEIITAQKWDFKKRMYYLPIPLSETEKTDLQQNENYK